VSALVASTGYELSNSNNSEATVVKRGRKIRALKTLIVLTADILLKALGDVNLSHGMKDIGNVHLFNPGTLLGIGFHVFTNAWILLGIALLIGYSLLELAGLSWLDLSYMLPMTAFTYVLTAFFAEWLLHEKISLTRWIGISVITLGVVIVGLGESKQKSQKAVKSSSLQDKNF
jgi:drug/metabolite transporter (DMT)-like permease